MSEEIQNCPPFLRHRLQIEVDATGVRGLDSRIEVAVVVTLWGSLATKLVGSRARLQEPPERDTETASGGGSVARDEHEFKNLSFDSRVVRSGGHPRASKINGGASSELGSNCEMLLLSRQI
ncbi:hypothetical protein NL676_002748 [Syzygium grande]|nr:hypothetical protein NL676_002748 [Syzygium grande]